VLQLGPSQMSFPLFTPRLIERMYAFLNSVRVSSSLGSRVEIEPLFSDCVDFETFSKSDFRAVKVKECVAVPKSKKLLQFTLDDGTDSERTILSWIHPYY